LELDVVVEVVPVVVVEVVPDVVVAVVAVVAVPEVSLIVLADVEVEVVELVSVAIVPLVEVSVAVDIVEDVSVAAALESVLLAAVSLLQAKPNTLRARTVRRTRSFLLMLFFPLVVGWLWVCPGIELLKKVPAHPPWQCVKISAKHVASQPGQKASSTRFATSMPAGRQAPFENEKQTLKTVGDERLSLGEGL
jgi:hypothetical protein